ncbi:unnamed protein product [Linum trigynum]
MMLHCKSADDDLKARTLMPHQGFHWSFHPNFFGGTLFFCAMDWGEGGLHWFDIYVNYRDNKRCKFCSWSIKKSGPCLVFKDRLVGNLVEPD